MFLIGAFIGILVPLTYYLADNLLWLVPAFIFTGIADGIISPPWTAIYANSIKNKHRGAVYGIANIFILTPTLFATLLGGIIVERCGGLTTQGIKPIYLIQLVFLLTAWFAVRTRLSERIPGQNERKISLKTMIKDYRLVLKRKGVKVIGSWLITLRKGSALLYSIIIYGMS